VRIRDLKETVTFAGPCVEGDGTTPVALSFLREVPAMSYTPSGRLPGGGFDAAVDAYDAARPGYPESLLDALFDYVGPPATLHLLEIGCGVGKATRQLARRGCRITAVEFGPLAAARARERLSAWPDVEVMCGAIEELAPSLGAFDVVVAALSFHFLDPDARCQLAHGLLRPGGTLALLSYDQVRGEGAPDFFVECQPIHRRIERDPEPPPTPSRDEYEPRHAAQLQESGLFEDIEVHTCDWDQRYDSATYALLVRSYSNTIAMEPETRERLISELTALIDRDFGGSIVRPLVASLVLARRA
jgi:SAM-dependent methyltransferase